MTQNEQKFINKINDLQNVIDWQKKAIQERDQKIEVMAQPKTCKGCIWFDENHPNYCDSLKQCSRYNHGWNEDNYEPKQ